MLVFYASAELINQLLPLFMVFHPAFITAKRFSNKIEIKWPLVFETVMLLLKDQVVSRTHSPPHTISLKISQVLLLPNSHSMHSPHNIHIYL